jgi:type I restriction enzyme S subunit
MSCDINGWKTYPISEVVQVFGGGTPKTTNPEYWNGNIHWLSVTDFNDDNRIVHTTEKTITETGLCNSSTKILKKGQLIISARGTVGALAQLGKDMAFNQSCYGLNAKNGFDNNFLYYRLKHDIESIKRKSHGSVFDTITRDTFKRMFANFPPLPEQQKIASTLKSLDDKIELLHETNETLEQIAQALFKHWFIDFEFPDENGNPYRSSGGAMKPSPMGMIPEDWEVKKVGEELKTILGGTPDRKNEIYWNNGEIPWINSGKVNEFRVVEPSEFITKDGYKNSATKLLPKRTTILAITGATLGQVSIVEIECCANQSVIGILESENICSEYIYLWIQNTINNIVAYQTGGAHQHINKKTIDESPLLLPDNETIRRFQNICKPIFNKIGSSCLTATNIKELRDLLLPRLMSGKIRVPVKEGDEPCQA